MGSVRLHPTRGTLFLDYRVAGKRHREYTALPDTPANRAKLESTLELLVRGVAQSLPDLNAQSESPAGGSRASEWPPPSDRRAAPRGSPDIPVFGTFAEQWVRDRSIEWRRSHLRTVRSTLDAHLDPFFGRKRLSDITRQDVLSFRSSLATKSGRRPGTRLSNKRINSVMSILKQVFDEAVMHHGIVSPVQGIKRLKLRRTDVQPFSFEEVQLILGTVRPDYRDYLLVRCFTGMRSGEVDGLQWKYVDFGRRLILIRETRVLGEDEYTKTDSSQRDIRMSTPVFEALRRQEAATRALGKYVFCNRDGKPIHNKNFVERIWNPLLRHLGLAARRPYQMRHTAATLWLAAGENPEWVARQLGHATTEMLFKVYSRYVPNLTRQDGSAFDRLLQSRM